jgi:hypothetical protein
MKRRRERKRGKWLGGAAAPWCQMLRRWAQEAAGFGFSFNQQARRSTLNSRIREYQFLGIPFTRIWVFGGMTDTRHLTQNAKVWVRIQAGESEWGGGGATGHPEGRRHDAIEC